PEVGTPVPTRVPQADAEGNKSSGVRMPELRVPAATYTGWKRRGPKAGGAEGLYGLQGSMIPFARTKAAREKAGDPRPAIDERYKDEAEYMRWVEAGSRELAKERFLLERDIPLVMARAKVRWGVLATPGVE